MASGGITSNDIKDFWLMHLNCSISLEACNKMIFEADLSNNGFLAFTDWLETGGTIHQCEL